MTWVRLAPAVALAIATVAAGLAGFAGPKTQTAKPSAQSSKPAVDKEAIDRTRDVVKMLDDVYKTTVVLMTDKYVHSDADYPAASVTVALFEAIEKKGWHTVRLIDATGEPYDPDNIPVSAFEKQAIKKLKAGETYAEKVVTRDGKPYLLAATAIPVVMEKCVLCHPHYEDAPQGQAIGALTYEIPIR